MPTTGLSEDEIKKMADEIRNRCAREKEAFESWWAGGKVLHADDARKGLGYERDKEIAWRSWYARARSDGEICTDVHGHCRCWEDGDACCRCKAPGLSKAKQLEFGMSK